ncbi:hypothetical protein WDW89_05080 [Deltaproteobacteria bacterium TL4]
MEQPSEIKYWTVNCQNLDDGEFDDLVGDLEKYIALREVDWILPQDNSDSWLRKFVESYAKWNGRKFSSKRPLSSYFEISKRLSYN